MSLSHPVKHLHYHFLQYLILFLLFAISFFAFQQSIGNKEKQLQIAVLAAFSYFFWGIFHHLYDKDLRPKIVVEYATIGLFGLGIIWAFLAFVI